MGPYNHFYRRARRFTRNRAEAEDLLHDALLAALKAGRYPLADPADPADARWFAGVLRNTAAMDTRTGVRRRARERVYAGSTEATRDVDNIETPFDAVLAPMPPAARAVAILVLHGLNAEEIRWIHRLSATAFRQRLTSIRRALKTLPEEVRAEALATALHRQGLPELELGLIRRALVATLKRIPGIGAHDPDGHLFVIAAGAHNPRAGGNRRSRRAGQ